jgi:hypothetical protein
MPGIWENDHWARRFKTHDSELAEIEAKFAFLKSSYLFEDKAKEILARYGREAGLAAQYTSDPKVTKAYADEVKKLTQEGRYNELAGLQQKYFSELPESCLRARDHRRENPEYSVAQRG